MILPSSVYVMGHEYKIEEMSQQLFEDMDAYGDCSDDHRRIRIYCKTNPDIIRDTVLHETLHACWNMLSLGKNEEEEKIVNSLSTVFIGIIDDPRNKDFVNIIMGNNERTTTT